MAQVQRKLTAILAADVHQFSRMMGEDETGSSEPMLFRIVVHIGDVMIEGDNLGRPASASPNC
jgi:hypothetical protein